uniref:START domain-containing protein 1 n=1 Tax=Sinocyclocheilus rhinocerous TaxID=307959 RepID=A0A673I837_9TELE
MLRAVLKLCCGITYPHLRSMAGLQRAALAAFGQEIAHLQSRGQMALPAWSPLRWTESETAALADEDVFYLKQGEAALNEALKIVESEDGWKLETAEKNGDVIYSKVLTGNRKVFRLEAELNASPEELHKILFFRVEEMHEWNPSIRHIKHLKNNVAEDGPTCIILQPLQDRPERSRFIWLLNMDVKGWLPQSLVNKALPRAQADFTKHLRRRLTSTLTTI